MARWTPPLSRPGGPQSPRRRTRQHRGTPGKSGQAPRHLSPQPLHLPLRAKVVEEEGWRGGGVAGSPQLLAIASPSPAQTCPVPRCC